MVSPAAKWVAGLDMKEKANPNALATNYPPLPSAEKLAEPAYSGLRGMADLAKTVVVVGFGEVGPWGSSRTRWEMESTGLFSMEACIELAWLVGLIRYHDGPLKKNKRVRHIGWIDAESEEPIADTDVKGKYEEHLLKHCGIRVVEPALFDGCGSPRREEPMHHPPEEMSMRGWSIRAAVASSLWSGGIRHHMHQCYAR